MASLLPTSSTTSSTLTAVSSASAAYLILLPLLLVHMAVSTMGLNPINQFVILKVCHELQPNATRPYPVCAKDSDVQTAAAFWVQAISLAIAIPTFFISPLIGLLLDRVGRRPILFLPFVAVILPAIAVLVIEAYDLGLWLLVLADLVKGCLGGNAVFVMTVYSMFADLTTGETRTRVFYLKEAFSLFGFSFGPYIGGLLYESYGLSTVFTVIIAAELIIVTYGLLFVKESLPESRRKPLIDVSTTLNPLVHLANSLKSLLKLFSTRTPTILALINATGALTQSAYVFIFFFVPSARFGWDSYESGRFLMVGSFCRFAYFAGIVPFIMHRLLARQNSHDGRVSAELWLIRAGLVTYVVTLTLFGRVTDGAQYYYIIPIYSFASSALPTLRALLSKTVAQNAQGQLFASLEVLQSLGSLVSHAVMPIVFRATVGFMPEAICYIVAAMWGVALTATFFVAKGELVGSD
ncbi:hypothetical protein HK100_012115 [Physocladia obscura]|uniref:Major facilitator superfamily (MFS) profile domain-containing protein n=1 Tax=Physocladia obscura TaxID=109957 RepID=A0AAD5T697_9FUNG|nr:hypothetical protein HK100_012115 [Physocladia obscura]